MYVSVCETQRAGRDESVKQREGKPRQKKKKQQIREEVEGGRVSKHSKKAEETKDGRDKRKGHGREQYV